MSNAVICLFVAASLAAASGCRAKARHSVERDVARHTVALTGGPARQVVAALGPIAAQARYSDDGALRAISRRRAGRLLKLYDHRFSRRPRRMDTQSCGLVATR
jgi:hypothetical protein